MPQKSHRFHSIIREKCLWVKEKWPFVLTGAGGFVIVASLVTARQSFSLGRISAGPAFAPAWWWYCGSTEGATALA